MLFNRLSHSWFFLLVPLPLVFAVATDLSRESPRSVICDRWLPRPVASYLCRVSFLSPSFKLMPLLVSVMPAPSPAEPSPRGVKRSRTPDRGGNGQTEGDQDDGTCAWERILSCLSYRGFVEFATFHPFCCLSSGRIWLSFCRRFLLTCPELL